MRIVLGLILAAGAWAQTMGTGAKVYIAPMGGFETDFKIALAKKGTPVTVVERRAEAEYEVTGTAKSTKSGAGKALLTGQWRSDEEASIQVTEVKSGTVVFALSTSKPNSAHGKRSSAEDLAKQLREKMEGKK